jgi:hypothetical protein
MRWGIVSRVGAAATSSGMGDHAIGSPSPHASEIVREVEK